MVISCVKILIKILIMDKIWPHFNGLHLTYWMWCTCFLTAQANPLLAFIITSLVLFFIMCFGIAFHCNIYIETLFPVVCGRLLVVEFYRRQTNFLFLVLEKIIYKFTFKVIFFPAGKTNLYTKHSQFHMNVVLLCSFAQHCYLISRSYPPKKV